MIFEGDVTASGCSAIGQIVYDRPSPGQPRAPPATPCESRTPPHAKPTRRAATHLTPNPPTARRPTSRQTLPPHADPPRRGERDGRERGGLLIWQVGNIPVG